MRNATWVDWLPINLSLFFHFFRESLLSPPPVSTLLPCSKVRLTPDIAASHKVGGCCDAGSLLFPNLSLFFFREPFFSPRRFSVLLPCSKVQATPDIAASHRGGRCRQTDQDSPCLLSQPRVIVLQPATLNESTQQSQCHELENSRCLRDHHSCGPQGC